MAVALPAAAQDATGTYVLGPGDRLELRVVIWNDDARQFELLPFFGGSYAIQSDGLASVPLAGAVPAAGKTRFDLARDIATALQSRAGLIDAPSVSVEIVQYRPFYVAGDVSSPGEYETRPGMTVAQAHALSGGRNPLRDEQNAALAAFRDTGRLRQALGETARVRVQIARLEAERDTLEDIVFPADNSHPDGPTALLEIETSETAIFQSRRLALEVEISGLEELKALLENEITSLEQKLVGLQSQIEGARENLQNLETLVERGISRAAGLLEAQRSLFGLESQELDLQDSVFRARQRINEADRDITALQNRRVSDVNRELQASKASFENLQIQADTLRRLIAENDAAAVAVDQTEILIAYSISRVIDGQTETFSATAGDLIQPGDVLRVEQITFGE